MAEANWYVVHTYSGYENKVKADLEMTIENRKLQDEILEVAVPMQDVVEVKDGVKKVTQKKMFPSYVIIHMVMNDDTWYVVRNTTGVTGFVGPGSKPIPLTDEEVAAMGVERIQLEMDVDIGETVRIISGAFANFMGEVTAVDPEKQTVTVVISLFGKETPCELDFVEIQKL